MHFMKTSKPTERYKNLVEGKLDVGYLSDSPSRVDYYVPESVSHVDVADTVTISELSPEEAFALGNLLARAEGTQ